MDYFTLTHCPQDARAVSQLCIYSSKWSVYYIIANYLAQIEFVGMFSSSESSWQKIPQFISIKMFLKFKVNVGGCKFHLGMPILHESWVLISIRKWMRSMDRSDLMPLWCFVWRNTFQINQNYNLALFHFHFLFEFDGLSQCGRWLTTGLAEPVSLSHSPHCSAMLWGPAPCSSVLQPVALGVSVANR